MSIMAGSLLPRDVIADVDLVHSSKLSPRRVHNPHKTVRYPLMTCLMPLLVSLDQVDPCLS